MHHDALYQYAAQRNAEDIAAAARRRLAKRDQAASPAPARGRTEAALRLAAPTAARAAG
ncbi:hypothetical protein [Actinokineospora sp. NPDC004072]